MKCKNVWNSFSSGCWLHICGNGDLILRWNQIVNENVLWCICVCVRVVVEGANRPLRNLVGWPLWDLHSTIVGFSQKKGMCAFWMMSSWRPYVNLSCLTPLETAFVSYHIKIRYIHHWRKTGCLLAHFVKETILWEVLWRLGFCTLRAFCSDFQLFSNINSL